MPADSFFLRLVATSLCPLWVVSLAGCNSGQSGYDTASPPGKSASKVIAQGQILPRGGIVRIAATPGDVVASIEVKVGEHVEQDKELIVLRSAALRAKQRAALEAQRAAAAEEQAQALQQATQQRRIAQEKLNAVLAREEGLERQKKMLTLAAEQLEASQHLLRKLEAIAANELTGEFVGELEVDRQRMAVGEANLKYQQKQAEYAQAQLDLDSARRAAEIELEISEETMQSIAASSAVAVIDAQLATLDEEIAASKITAPTAGTILAINTKKGEAAAQFPLIEMADLNQLVCEVEVNEIDAGRVKPGNRVLVTSRAFEKPLEGEVISKSTLIGRPTLRPVDPLARSDFRTVTTVVALDESSLADDWLQLHVQAEILVDESAAQAKGTEPKQDKNSSGLEAEQ